MVLAILSKKLKLLLKKVERARVVASPAPATQEIKGRSIPENSVESKSLPFTDPAPRKESITACTMQYDPVCDINGKTHSNACVAGLAGVKVNYAGECRVADRPSATSADSN